jgi:hypothetical protein
MMRDIMLYPIQMSYLMYENDEKQADTFEIANDPRAPTPEPEAPPQAPPPKTQKPKRQKRQDFYMVA